MEPWWVGLSVIALLVSGMLLAGLLIAVSEAGVFRVLADRLKRPPRDVYDEKLEATNGRIDMVVGSLIETDDKHEVLAARVYELEKKAGLR